MKRTLLTVAAVILALCLALCGCAAKSESPAMSAPAAYDMTTSEEGYADYPAEEPAPEAVESEADAGIGLNELVVPDTDRKIILNYDMYIQTKGFTADMKTVTDALKAAGGYMQSSELSGEAPKTMYDSGRYAYMIFRVPSDKAEEFVATLNTGMEGKVVRSNSSGQDVTDAYTDVELRLESLRSLYAQLQELLEQTTVTEDIVELYREMSDVTYEIESLEGQKRHYDNLVQYVTITVELQEVNTIVGVDTPDTEKTFGEKVSSGFYKVINALGGFFEGLGVVLLAGSPVIILLGGIALVIVLIVKGGKKGRAKREAKKREKAAAAARIAVGGSVAREEEITEDEKK